MLKYAAIWREELPNIKPYELTRAEKLKRRAERHARDLAAGWDWDEVIDDEAIWWAVVPDAIAQAAD